jgi:hypothetical protein
MKTTRRGALQAIASLPVLGQAQDHTTHTTTAAAPPAPKPYTPKIFTPAELAALSEWVDLMIPGAAAARVPEILDWEASRRPDSATRWREALAAMTKAAETEPKLSLLTRWSIESGTSGARWFKLLKDSAIDAYYSTREGLQQELGWNANTYLPEFTGCTHPEHQG